MLVIIGATPEGRKELLGFQVGVRESAQSWRELLVDLKARGLSVPPELAVGDGALGFWKALDEVFPAPVISAAGFTRCRQRPQHFPKSMQPAVTADLREISHAETRAAALAAIETFAEKYGAKYERGVTCLTKDHEALLAFYDFPAEHWDHLRTGNPIESVFATVRHRTVRTKGALSQKTAKLMVFTLVRAGVEDMAQAERREPVANASSKASNSPTASPPATPPKAAPPDQAASPKFSHSSLDRLPPKRSIARKGQNNRVVRRRPRHPYTNRRAECRRQNAL
jgi:transposase-like protein